MAILITRSMPNARYSAQSVQNLGYDVHILPLSKTVAVTIKQKSYNAEMVFASSAASFKHLPPDILDKIKNLPIYVIGEKTAKAAKKSGMRHIIAYYENNQDFLNRAKIPIDSSIIYLIGKQHIDTFVQKLQKKFQHLSLLELYDTQSIKLTDKDIAKLPKTIEVIMLYSALAAENIVQLQKYIDKNTVFLCLSERIAQALPHNLSHKIIIAKKPNEQAMLEVLKYK